MKRWEHELFGEFGDYKIVEELDDDGTIRVSLEMDPPVGQYDREIWSWTGRRKASPA